MDIFSKVGEELENAGAELVRVTRNAADSARWHATIVSEKSKISEQCRKLGEALYRRCKEDEEMKEILGEDFVKAMEAIDASRQKIAEAKDNFEQKRRLV